MNNNNYVTIKEHHKNKHGRTISQNKYLYSSIFQDPWLNSSIFKAWNYNYQIPVYSRFSRICTNPVLKYDGISEHQALWVYPGMLNN